MPRQILIGFYVLVIGICVGLGLGPNLVLGSVNATMLAIYVINVYMSYPAVAVQLWRDSFRIKE